MDCGGGGWLEGWKATFYIQDCLIVTELAGGREGGCHDSGREKLETTERGNQKTVRAGSDLQTGQRTVNTTNWDLGQTIIFCMSP